MINVYKFLFYSDLELNNMSTEFLECKILMKINLI